jgi:predicted nuclease of predicted toxin-antitoxin system
VGWRRIENAPLFEAGRSRFLVDENMDYRVVRYLSNQGYNARAVSDGALRHHDDQDVLATAWREQRILLTHDQGFLDERRYPPHRNPGIIVLPGGSGDFDTLDIALKLALAVVGNTREVWLGATVQVSTDFVFTVRTRDFETGARTTSRYMSNLRDTFEWVDDE